MQETILIIDDDSFLSQMKEHLSPYNIGFKGIQLSAAAAAMEGITSGKALQPGAILIDLVALGDAGLRMVYSAREARPELPIITFTRYGDREHCAAAMKAGAHDFLTKPVGMERLRLTLQHAMRIRRMHRYIDWLERKVAGHVDFSDIVGHNPGFRHALSQAREAAMTPLPVWIEGEEGTGKELVARAIHGAGERAGKPFIAVHCNSLPEATAETALFGQDKGFQPSQVPYAFGSLRAADTGTLMLKEVGALKPAVQKRLLAFLNSGSITPSGSEPVKLDVRIICAATTQGASAIDPQLLSRLKRQVITLPSLQERKGDIERLAEHFLLLHAASENKYIKSMTERAQKWLVNSAWPGNAAQLSQVIWRAVLLCDTPQLDVDDLQAVQKSKSIYFAEVPRDLAAAAAGTLLDEKGRVKTLKSVEQDAIRFALQHTGGCMARAARSLGIGRSTLYRKVNELELDTYIARDTQTTRPMMDISSSERS